MRTTLLLSGILFLASAQGQITIGEADMPSAGDTMRFRSFDAASILLDQTGADQVWDYGDLTPMAEVADTR
jgi:hypothetical protein